MEGHDSELHIQLRGDLVYSLGSISRSLALVLSVEAGMMFSPSAIMLRLALQALQSGSRGALVIGQILLHY